MPTPEELVKANPVTFSQYLRLVALAKEDNPSLRNGQVYFNVLNNVRPDLANRIRSTLIDPYYEDCNLAQFLVFVSKEWE